MSRPRFYNINEDYFNNPIDKKQSYILGLILSDGSLNYDRGGFNYVCKQDDIELIEFIKQEFNSTHLMRFYEIKHNPYVRFSVSNIKLIRSLIDKFNLPHGNKSKNNLTIPTNIPIEYLSHFLRGMFDGDGSIWGKTFSYAAYCGGEMLMNDIKNILKKSININGYVRYRYSKENKNSCSLEISGTLQVDTLGDYLYKDMDMCLLRKKERFNICKIFANKFRNKSFSYNGNESKIIEMYNNHIPQIEISKKLNLVFSSVRGCVNKLRRNNIII